MRSSSTQTAGRGGQWPLAVCVAAGVALGQAAAAQSTDCADALERASEETKARDASSALSPLRDLVVAARRLDDAGFPNLCVDVIEAVREMAQAGDAPGRPPAIPPQQRSDAARDAAPFGAMAARLSSDLVMDWQVRTMRGTPVGWVDGLVSENGAGVTHLIVGHGGFLGVGDREVAVPTSLLRFNVLEKTFYVDATPQWFDDRPDWNPTRWLGDDADWAPRDDAGGN